MHPPSASFPAAALHPTGGAAFTLVDLLALRAREAPDRVAYFFDEGGDGRGRDTAAERRLDHAELDRRARAGAVSLWEAGVRPGDRVLLLYPPGIDYVVGLFSCFYAGAVAVPAYPPDPGRLERTLPRLRTLVSDCGAAVALTTTPVRDLGASLFAGIGELAALRWLATDAVPVDLGERWVRPPLAGDSHALLQYTSGSTDVPRGVVLHHAHLLHNAGLLRRAMELSPSSVAVIWLPPYHDMGLIGGILAPLCV